VDALTHARADGDAGERVSRRRWRPGGGDADATGDIQVAFVDQGYTGEAAAEAAATASAQSGQAPAAKRGFVLLRRWVVRSFAWRATTSACRRCSGLASLAFALLLLKRFVTAMAEYAQQALGFVREQWRQIGRVVYPVQHEGAGRDRER
jgi:hypothetical protein